MSNDVATPRSFRELPEGLDELAPGPALSALLASLDPADFNGWQLVELLAAQQRQVCFEQGRLLAMARELPFTPNGYPHQDPVRCLDQDPFVGTEIGFALAMTEHAAGSLAELAVWAIDRVPALGAAVLAGRLDLAKVKVIVAELGDATPAHARTVLDALLPEVDRLTTAQLRARLRRLLLTLDPDAVRTRHAKAVADRYVTHDQFANGTSSITGSYLRTDRAAAAFGHLDAIAHATKAAGDPRELDQIRADVFTDLLTGIDPTHAGAVTPAPRPGIINLQIGLTTLACLDEHPGQIAGFGPVLADIARQSAAQLAATARWRFTTRDDHDTVIAEGPLTRTALRQAGLTRYDPENHRPNATKPAPPPTCSTRAGSTRTGGAPTGGDPYRPTAAQKAFVQARDNTCRAPGCQRPAHRCDTDHIRTWATTHTTTIGNLCLLCRRHHRAKHIAGYQIQRGTHGIDWTTPRGHHYTVITDTAPPPSTTERHLAARLHGHPIAHLRR